MRYQSSRGGESVSPAAAIVRGICPLGGLYVPESFPQIKLNEVLSFAGDYKRMALEIMKPYLDTEESVLQSLIAKAYGEKYDTDEIVPLVKLSDAESVLELFHGPTLAFKDMALQMLPHLLSDSRKREGVKENVYILVATSGDTGKAALEGFADVEGTKIQVFYPHGGVSRAQELQMITQEGENVSVCALKGNFDDAQSAVKRIFADANMKDALAVKGYRLSSANSINFGRLLPQVVYYFSAYADACKAGTITAGTKINFAVPTGNFGDILAGYYAMRMGLPVNRFIVASNRNNVLSDFFKNGVYDSKRPFMNSMSCSIDILISSNLERLVFESTNRNASRVVEHMQALASEGKYELSKEEFAFVSDKFYANWCDEDTTLKTIRRIYDEKGYLMDPHTAVGQTVYESYVQETGDTTHTVVLSTASPFKFASDVLRAFETPTSDDFANAKRLSNVTGNAVPSGISELETKPILHNALCEMDAIDAQVLSVI